MGWFKKALSTAINQSTHPTPFAFTAVAAMVLMTFFITVSELKENREARADRAYLVQNLVTLMSEFDREYSSALQFVAHDEAAQAPLDPQQQATLRQNIQRQIKVAESLVPLLKGAQAKGLRNYRETLVRMDAQIKEEGDLSEVPDFWSSADDLMTIGDDLHTSFYRSL